MTKDKPVIVFDIDGVLFSTPIDAVAYSNHIHGTKHKLTDVFDHNAVHNEEIFIIDGVDQFWNFQKLTHMYTPTVGAQEAIKKLSKFAKLIALTSRSYDMFYDSTCEAIYKFYGNSISEIYFTTSKGSGINGRNKGEMILELGGDLLIDDAVKHCESCSKVGIPAILFSQPYNKTGHDYPAELTATNLSEVIAIAKNLLTK